MMKKSVFLFFALFILLSYAAAPLETAEAARRGLLLWFYQLIPVLFPCMILSNIVLSSGVIPQAGRGKVFAIVFFGLLCGFPVGAKLSCDFFRKGLIGRETASACLAYTNQLGLAYLRSVVLSACLKDSFSPVFLVIFYLVPLILLAAELPRGQKILHSSKKTASRFQLNIQIIDAGIVSGFETLIKLCGYLVIFSVVSARLASFHMHEAVKCILLGAVENTSGIRFLQESCLPPELKCILAMGMVSFGGISCICQTNSILAESGLSIRPYLMARIKMCILSVGLTCIYLFCGCFL